MGKKVKAKTNSPTTGAAVKSKADDKKSGVKKIKKNKQRRKKNKPKTGNGESEDSELRAAIRELGGDEEEQLGGGRLCKGRPPPGIRESCHAAGERRAIIKSFCFPE